MMYTKVEYTRSKRRNLKKTNSCRSKIENPEMLTFDKIKSTYEKILGNFNRFSYASRWN